jgi:hypothetical protein
VRRLWTLSRFAAAWVAVSAGPSAHHTHACVARAQRAHAWCPGGSDRRHAVQVKLAEGWLQAGKQEEFSACVRNLLETQVRMDEEAKAAAVRSMSCGPLVATASPHAHPLCRSWR